MKHREVKKHQTIPTRIKQIIDSTTHTKTKLKETIGINKLKETIGIIKEPKAIVGIIRNKEEPGTITQKTRIMRIMKIKTMEGDSKELVSFVGREDTRQKTVGTIQKTHT